MKNLVLHDVKNDFFVSFPLFCSWAVLLDRAFLCWQAHGFDALNKEKKKEWADELDYTKKSRQRI